MVGIYKIRWCATDYVQYRYMYNLVIRFSTCSMNPRATHLPVHIHEQRLADRLNWNLIIHFMRLRPKIIAKIVWDPDWTWWNSDFGKRLHRYVSDTYAIHVWLQKFSRSIHFGTIIMQNWIHGPQFHFVFCIFRILITCTNFATIYWIAIELGIHSFVSRLSRTSFRLDQSDRFTTKKNEQKRKHIVCFQLFTNYTKCRAKTLKIIGR